MKTLNMGSHLLVIGLLALTAACNAPKVTSSKIKSAPRVVSAPAALKVKNYNQYNMTLQKLTGINRSKYNETFEALKGSLPSDNEISGMTPFNLLAMSRLADAYCMDYVAQKIPATYFRPGQEDLITDFMIDKFLDQEPEGQPEYYSSLRTEIGNIYANDDGTGNKLFPNPSTDLTQAMKDSTVAACVTILASPYITLLE